MSASYPPADAPLPAEPAPTDKPQGSEAATSSSSSDANTTADTSTSQQPPPPETPGRFKHLNGTSTDGSSGIASTSSLAANEAAAERLRTSDESFPSPSPNRRRRTRPSSPIPEEPEAEEMHDDHQQRRRGASNSQPGGEDGAVPASSSSREQKGSAQSHDDVDQGPRKRARREDPDAKKRGARMFGLLNSTLTKFKTDAERQKTNDAAKRRASLEARTQERLKRESHEITLKKRLEGEQRADLAEALRLAEVLALREAEHRTRRAQKRRMASFLWTSGLVESDLPRYRTSSLRAAANGSSGGGGGKRGRRDRTPPSSHRGATAAVTGEEEAQRIAPHIPSTLAPLSRRANEEGEYPLYFLPFKLLPSQDDVLDQQEARVDDEIDKADEEWDREREEIERRLREVKERITRKRKEVLADLTLGGGEEGGRDGEADVVAEQEGGSAERNRDASRGREAVEAADGEGLVA